MLSVLKKLFGRHGGSEHPVNKPDLASEFDWMFPPADLRDAKAWDVFWQKHIEHGLGPPLFDMFCDDRELVSTIHAKGMKSVLCAGSGLSLEPRALAKAGLKVVALDISAWALDFAREVEIPPHVYEMFIDPDMWHSGGSVEYVVGDILDSSVCPGPFDVVIERRTAQDYLHDDMGAVLEALAGRMQEKGLFLSHCHDSQGGPGREACHFTESWFESNGWEIRRGEIDKSPSGRFALLEQSTG